MDSNTDDRDPDIPPVETSQDLEEALKWLEELTARQGKSADLPNPVPAASLDSPFHGLIESDEGDLPDWLRETPSSPNLEAYVEGEVESRLDWLAKMAQRESIEELPTLEWRRLSEPMQSSILPAQREIPVEELSAEFVDDSEISEEAPKGIDEVPELVVPEESIESLLVTETLVAEELDRLPDEASVEPAVSDASLTGAVDAEKPAAELPESEMVSPPVDNILETFEIEPDEELPPIDDLDAAMAWIEELAASQDAPIEDIPSVADRALASKLMMEAGLTLDISPLDELGSDSDLIEGRTPTHPFIEEEDFADTIVLVETMVADQNVDMMPDMPGDLEGTEIGKALAISEDPFEDTSPLSQRAETTVPGEITPYDAPPDELSFEEAMALLDEMAAEQAPEPHTVEAGSSDEEIAGDQALEPDIVEAAVVVDEISDDSTSTEAAGLAAAIDTEGNEEVSLDVEPIDAAPLLAEEAPLIDHPVVATTAVAAGMADEEEETKDEVVDTYDDAQLPALLDEEPDEEPIAVPVLVGLVDKAIVDDAVELANGQSPLPLEAALLALDTLALPPGRTLDDVDASLRAAHAAPQRDVPSALDWLERALAPKEAILQPPAGLDEEGLIAQMPEDPDAVLAWLEQMADEEAELTASSPSPPEVSAVIAAADAVTTEPLVEELAEADLLNMPEDPDEAMAWLEGLARGSTPSPAPPVDPAIPAEDVPSIDTEQIAIPEDTPIVEPTADESSSAILAEETVVKPRKRRAKKVESEAAPEEPEPPAPPSPAKEKPGAAWVDLLKPLD